MEFFKIICEINNNTAEFKEKNLYLDGFFFLYNPNFLKKAYVSFKDNQWYYFGSHTEGFLRIY